MNKQSPIANPFPWTIHRDRNWNPRWWQRFYEAALVISGKYTFWHAWHDGKHQGSIDEYRRVVCNGGDLMPIIDAAIYATARDISKAEPTADKLAELRRAAWEKYRHDDDVSFAFLRRPAPGK